MKRNSLFSPAMAAAIAAIFYWGVLMSQAAVTRLDWGKVPDSATQGEGFPMTLTLRDEAGAPVNLANGSVNVYASVFPANPESTVMNGLAHNYVNNSGRFDLGWAFRPRKEVRVTALRSYFGVRIRLLDSTGKVLAQQELPEGGGRWFEVALLHAVLLQPGQRYEIKVDTGGFDYYARRHEFEQPILQNDALEILYGEKNDLWMVDLKFTEVPRMVSVIPTALSEFPGGTWSGDITLPVAGGYAFLEAELEGKHSFSQVFQVAPENNLSLKQTTSFAFATVGEPFAYKMRAKNSGPLTAEAVVVRAKVPPFASILKTTASKGTIQREEDEVVFNIGTLEAREEVDLEMVVVPANTGNLQQEAEITAATIDNLAVDNSVRTSLQVTGIPQIRVKDVAVFSRTSSGLTTNAIIEVSLSEPSGRPVSVTYETQNRTAVEGADFDRAVGTLLFAPGVTMEKITILIKDGVANEGNEQFAIVFSAPENGALERREAICQIINPALKPTVTVADVRVAEGNEDFGVEAQFVFRLSHPMDVAIHGELVSHPESAHAMSFPPIPGDSDFYEIWGGWGFAPGETESVVGVPIHGDTTGEGNETFKLLYWGNLANTTNDFARATIIDDDPIPAVTVHDASVTEDSTGKKKLVFPVSLSKSMNTQVSFSYETRAGTALAEIDYESKSGVKVLQPGETSSIIEVFVLPDNAPEPTEILELSLSAPSQCKLVRTRATGTLRDGANKLPTIEITNPAYGSEFTIGESISITATATDPDGEVASAQLFLDGEKVADFANGTITYNWTPINPGTHLIVVRSTDSHGDSRVSSDWPITFKSGKQLVMTAPLNNSVINENSTVGIHLSYSGTSTLDSLEIRANGELIAQLPGTQRFFEWTAAGAGPIDLTAHGAIADGGTIVTDPIRVIIKPAPPANDLFEFSSALNGFAPFIEGSNRGASVELNEPIHGNPSARASVWYSWDSPGRGTATITATNLLGEPMHAVVYLGHINSALVAKAQISGHGRFDVNEGQRYFIAIDGSGAYAGPFTLRLAMAEVTISSPAAQANFSAPTVVSLRANVNAPPETIRRVEFYENAMLIGVAYATPYEFQWEISTNGHRRIKAVAIDILDGSRSSAEVPFEVRPINDHFQNATPIAGHVVDIETSTVAATLELHGRGFPWQPRRNRGEPTYADNQGGHSIWYQWVVPEDGLCSIHGAGSDFILMLGVYVGNTVSNLTHVAINAMGGWDQPLTFQAAKGTTLYISVDGMFGEEGSLAWWLRLRPRNDNLAQADVIKDSYFEATGSHRGAGREAFEAPLHPANANSVWWSWKAPATARATVETSSTAALNQLRIYKLPQTTLIPVNGETTEWSSATSASFDAVGGATYYFAVLAQTGETNDFRIRLNQELLRVASPLNGSALKANNPVRITASIPASLGTVSGARFFVNGELVGTDVDAPFEAVWGGGPAGTYTLSAQADLTGGQSAASLPVTIVLYEQNQLPVPSLVVNPRGIESLAKNAVGSLYVFGNHDGFAAAGQGERSQPRAGRLPSGVSEWARIGGGLGDVLDNTPWSKWPRPDGYHNWSLTPEGVLYKDATNHVPFPLGVARWRSFFGAGNALVIGDDGRIYMDGTTLIDLGIPNVRWKDLSIGYVYLARLSEEGEVWMSGGGTFGEPVHQKLQNPQGVKFTEMKGSIYALLLRGDDGKLYQNGDPKPAESLAGGAFKEVPLPTGVTNFVAYAMGGFHALAIGNDGELYSWGRNWEGQLGVGSQSEGVLVPQKVPRPPGVSAWTAAAGGYMHTMAIGNDCSLYVWGSNESYELGLGQVPSQLLPQRVDSIEALCGIPAVYTDGETTRLPDGSFKLRFESALNRSYLIQYSSDTLEWKTAQPPVVGTGSVLDWVDDGPPKTDSHPITELQRFYRVVFGP